MFKMYERNVKTKGEIMEIGTVCMKIAGREAGSYCVIVENVDDSFVIVTGPKSITRIKRRRCNVNHLETTQEKFEIKEKEEDSKIEGLWKKSNLIEKFDIQVPKVKSKPPQPKEEPQPKSKQKGTK